MTAYIVFAHGSSVESANEAVRAVSSEAARRGGWTLYETAFLGGGRPNLEEAVAKLAAEGAADIVVIPYFLTLGTHMQRDLPRLAQDASQAHGGIEMQITSPLDGHPALVQALLDRASEALT